MAQCMNCHQHVTVGNVICGDCAPQMVAVVRCSECRLYTDNEHKRYIAERYRNFFIQVHTITTPKECREIYEGLISGDPKLRAFRALYNRIYGRYVAQAKKAERTGGECNE